MITIKSKQIKDCVKHLANNVRAENIDYKSYLELYSGIENIENICNLNNSVVYGRRGSGKTHLLRALSEKILENYSSKRWFPIYVDLRRIIPLIPNEIDSPESNAILIFKYIIQEISHSVYINIFQIYGYNPFSDENKADQKKKTLSGIFSRIYLESDGTKFKRSKELTVSEEEKTSLSGSGAISSSPSLSLAAGNEMKTTSDFKVGSYVSILNITNEIEDLISTLELDRIFLLLDEWSEIKIETQVHLAELLKRTFSAIKVTLKIAAIPNRTNLGFRSDSKFVGLEDGGDIFGYPLDMRYVFEVNKNQTRDFFNDLLLKHLCTHDEASIKQLTTDNKINEHKFINIFLANVALNEILIASAGIPQGSRMSV